MTGRRVHTGVWGLAAAISLLALGVLVMGLARDVWGVGLLDRVALVMFGLVPVAFAVTAAMIVASQPRNAVGWLLMVVGFGAAIETLAGLWVGSSSQPPDAVDAWLLAVLAFINFSWVLLVFPVFHLLLVFPDGRLVSRRWRPFVVLELVMVAVMVVTTSFSRRLGPFDESWSVANPIGFVPVDFFDLIAMPWLCGLVILPVAGVVAQVTRFRRADDVQRQQVKWLLYGAGVFALTYSALAVFDEWEDGGLTDLLLGPALIGLAIAIAMAVLRRRLYEIDRIISRTVGYAVVVGLLGLVYVLGAVWLPTRLATDSSLFVAGSTLVVAALFAPVRRRVVSWVDRRFYRARFDAEQVAEVLAASLRERTDPDALVAEWIGAVRASMNPVAVGVWIRD